MMNDRNFRTLDLNLLRVFDEVMVERNLTRAAHNLAMTQPAVSNALRRLRGVGYRLHAPADFVGVPPPGTDPCLVERDRAVERRSAPAGAEDG